MTGQYSNYLRDYKETLDAICTPLGIDPHVKTAFDKKGFDQATAHDINQGIVNMFKAGENFAVNYASEAASMIKDISIASPRVYFASKDEKISAKVHDIIEDLYSAYNYGIESRLEMKRNLENEEIIGLFLSSENAYKF